MITRVSKSTRSRTRFSKPSAGPTFLLIWSVCLVHDKFSCKCKPSLVAAVVVVVAAVVAVVVVVAAVVVVVVVAVVVSPPS